jgi:hypothetical protein
VGLGPELGREALVIRELPVLEDLAVPEAGNPLSPEGGQAFVLRNVSVRFASKLSS